jgi:hypothetical protein
MVVSVGKEAGWGPRVSLDMVVERKVLASAVN